MKKRPSTAAALKAITTKVARRNGEPSNRRAAFVREYLIDHNSAAASVRAGYSPVAAASTGCRLLRCADVRAAVDREEERLAAKAGLTAELVRETLARALRFDPADTVDADGNALDLPKMPRDVRLALAGHERRPVFSMGIQCGEIRTVKYPEKVPAAMGAAKLLGMITDKTEHSGSLTLEQLVVASFDPPPAPPDREKK